MHKRLLLTLLPLALVPVAIACSAPAPDAATSDPELIGGEVAEPGAFPSTLQIVGNCTVTKVGENVILTAAHCVRNQDGSLRNDFLEGRTMQIRHRGAANAAAAEAGEDAGVEAGPAGNGEEISATLTIKRTVIHPRIAHYCKTKSCGGRASDERRDAPDIAIIEVAGGLEGIPTAAVDLTPAKPGDEVTILGYGCKTDVWAGDIDGKLRYRNTRLVPASAAIHTGGLRPDEADGLRSIEANNVFTKGPVSEIAADADTDAGDAAADAAAPELQAGLCPGDSGGALYRKGANVVVGVNASYTFLPNGRIPVTNWHVRVDRDARWGTAQWLESMGVRMTGNCTAGACTPVSFEDTPAGDAGNDAAPPADGGK